LPRVGDIKGKAPRLTLAGFWRSLDADIEDDPRVIALSLAAFAVALLIIAVTRYSPDTPHLLAARLTMAAYIAGGAVVPRRWLRGYFLVLALSMPLLAGYTYLTQTGGGIGGVPVVASTAIPLLFLRKGRDFVFIFAASIVEHALLRALLDTPDATPAQSWTLWLSGLSIGTVFGTIWLSMRVRVRELADSERAARDRAIKEARAKSEFLANISHELRTPMNGIMGMNHLLSTSELSDEQREWLAIQEQSSETLLSLLNDLLDFSRGETDKLTLDPQPFGLAECISSALAAQRIRAAGKGITLAVEIANEVPRKVVGDSLRLRQTLTNLVDNAIKFTDSGGVTVNVAAEQERLRFDIVDTGIGIEDASLDDVLLPFVQADGSTTRQYGGSGLGLAIVQQLVDLMDGELTVESELGKGSAFSFTARLPAASDT